MSDFSTNRALRDLLSYTDSPLCVLVHNLFANADWGHQPLSENVHFRVQSPYIFVGGVAFEEALDDCGRRFKSILVIKLGGTR